MKPKLVAGIVISAICFSLSCTKGNEHENNVVVDKVEEWQISLASNVKEMSWYDPYLIARNGHELSVFFHDPECPEITSMLYINAIERFQIVLVASENSVMFMPLYYSIDSEGNMGPVVAVDSSDEFSELTYGYISGADGGYVVSGSVPLEDTLVQTKGNIDPWNRSIMDSFADIYKKTFTGETMEKWANQQDFFTGLGVFTRYFLRFATAAGTVSLYENVDREAQQDAADEYYEFVERDMLWKIALSPIQALPASNALSTMTQLFVEGVLEVYGSQISDNKAENKTSEWSSITRSLSSSINNAQRNRFDNSIPYSVTVEVDNIDETTAVIKGSFAYIPGVNTVDMTIIERGFSVTSRSKSWTIPSEDLSPVKISLEPSTSYTVRAYVKTLRGKWESGAKSFYTKGTRFEYSPGSFVFNYSGGNLASNISMGDGISWQILASPSWCKCQKSTSALYISVGRTTNDRSGVIILESKNYYGEIKKYELQVLQEQSSWDNTVWVLKGVYYWGSTPSEIEEEVSFKSISSGYTERGDGYIYDYSVNESGQAIMVYTEPHPYYSNLKMVETYCFTRTGPDTATALLSGYAENPGLNNVVKVEISGEFVCTRKK
ncbi:MAG: hypothetical protein IK008_07385 [Bacteroidales bacterium]|nr:hypothetical protein [Bacteroidales bacterium]